MRVLGIDPGLEITGYGVVDGHSERAKLVEAGVVRTDPAAMLESRLAEIGAEIAGILSQFRPDAVAVEDLYSHYAHPKTAIIMGHARGIVFLRAAEAGIPVHQYAATRIKKSLTGNGRASKQQIQMMIKSTLGLMAIPEPPDAADALATALCHCRAMQHREAVAG
jgi:crossover junction endodeoxyribonuclease RuvC